MLRIALLATLVAATLAQNLEDCSSGGPEFWCASCGNAEACSALIPGLVDYCEQIGIFTRGQCGGEDGTGESDTVTIPPTTNPPTAPDPTSGFDDKLAPEQPTEYSLDSWTNWDCFLKNQGVSPSSDAVISVMEMDLENLNRDREICWEKCKADEMCKAVSFSPLVGSLLTGNFISGKCYLLSSEELIFEDKELWESALKFCWETKEIESPTKYDTASWRDWSCFLDDEGVNPNEEDVYWSMMMDENALNVDKETCWKVCVTNPECKSVSFSPLTISTLTDEPLPRYCYLSTSGDLNYALQWQSAKKSCWEDESSDEDGADGAGDPEDEADEADEPGTAYTDESWVDWACFMQNKGVIPTMDSVYGEMVMDPEQLNVGKETCWDNCRFDPECKGVSFSPMMGSTLSGNFVPAKCYLSKSERLADSYLWESALKSCWEFETIVPKPNCIPGSGCVAPFPDDMPLIPPYINIAPINITVPPGATAQFKCAAIGAPAPTITIMSRDEALTAYNAPTYAEWIEARDSNPDTSAVNIIQEIEDVTYEHEGWYRCMAGNAQGAVYEDAYLQVLDLCGTITCEAPKVCEADYILGSAQCGCGEPCDTTFDVICGFDCNTYFNPCQLDQMNCESETNIGIWTQGMCPTVERPRVTAAYLERAFEEDNLLRSDMELDVEVRTIERINEGEYFIMFCQATGNPPPQLSWWKDGQMVFQGPDYEVEEASFDSAGVYTCRAMNCIYGGEKENEHESNGIEVQIAERPAGEPLGTPCQVFGDPHIVTFDNKLFDYMGDCNYVLSMDCEWGEWIVYGNFKQCGPKQTGYPASCLVDVTVFYNNIGLNLQRGWIVVHRGEKVPLKMNGEVDILEGNQPTGIKIGYDGLYITVTLPNGILVTWDGIISAQVILLKDSVRQTCGLCGNNDGDADNEFFARFKNDVNVDSINMFGNSWEVDRMDTCVAVQEEMKPNEICDMYPDRRDEGIVRCPEVFNNPIWTECKEFLSTEGYEEKCRYDFCALEDMRELLLADCGTAAAYAQQCKAISGIYINQSRWRAAVNCPTVADQQEGTLPYGCPQQTFPWNGTSTIVL